MRTCERLRHWLARSDVQTASIISAALGLCVILPGIWLYAHLATESLREVDRWFSSDDREWPFAFERICEVLSLNASLIRGAIDGKVGSRLMIRPEQTPVAAERVPLADALADTL